VDDPEATQLMLEALFVIKGQVNDIHREIFGGDDVEGPEEEDA
jgi:hypothetical protein